MNLPNKLTVSRIALTIIFILLILKEGAIAKIIGALVFALASFTDFLDGYFARKNNLETDFGKIMDPIADKFLMLSAFYIFMLLNLIAPWMFWIIALREVLITVLRLFAIRKGIVLAAENMGKIKTVSQIFVIFIILLYMILNASITLSNQVWQVWYIVNNLLVSIVVILTVLSGVSFLKNNRSQFNVG